MSHAISPLMKPATKITTTAIHSRQVKSGSGVMRRPPTAAAAGCRPAPAAGWQPHRRSAWRCPARPWGARHTSKPVSPSVRLSTTTSRSCSACTSMLPTRSSVSRRNTSSTTSSVGVALPRTDLKRGPAAGEVRLIQMKSAGQGLPLAERRTTRAGPRVMMTRRARAGSGRLVTGRTGRQHGQGDQIGSEVRFGEEGQFVGNGTTKPTKGPTPEFRRTRAPAGPGLPIPQMGPVRMATLKIYKECFRRWSIPPGSRGVPGLRARRSERCQMAARRAGPKAGHQNCWRSKLLKRNAYPFRACISPAKRNYKLGAGQRSANPFNYLAIEVGTEWAK